MPRSNEVRLADIIQAIGKIQRYVRGMDLDAFKRDDRTVDAVVRNLEVIGEAAKGVSPELRVALRISPGSESGGCETS